jgi:hypothetical protein
VARRKVVAINRARQQPDVGEARRHGGRRRALFNAEPPASVLADAEITALDTFYSRNHGPFPDIHVTHVASRSTV